MKNANVVNANAKGGTVEIGDTEEVFVTEPLEDPFQEPVEAPDEAPVEVPELVPA